MKELISLPQANHAMLALLVIAPIIGAIWGAFTKQLVRGIVYGVVIGFGNLALWNIYNAITDRLGLDTVKNLLVNLGLFVAIGAIAGYLIGRFEKPAKTTSEPAE